MHAGNSKLFVNSAANEIDTADTANPNSMLDAGVGSLCAGWGVMGAYLNVKINAADLKDKAFAEDMLTRGAEIQRQAIDAESEILSIVEKKIA